MPNPLIDAVIARDGKDAYSAGLKKIQDNKAKKGAEQPKQDTQRQLGMLPHSTLNDAPESVRNQLEGKPLSPQQPSSQYGQPAIPKAPSAPSVQPFGGGAFNADDALASKDPYRMMADKGQPIAQVGTQKEWKDSGVVQPYEVNPYKGKAVLPYSTKELRDTYVTLQNDGRFLLDIRASKIKDVNGSRDFSVENFKEVPQSKSQIDNYRILDSEGLSQSRKAMGKFYNVPASKLYGTPEAKAELDRRNAQVVAVKIIGLSNGDLSYNDFQALRRDILNGRGNVYSYNVADFIASKREQKGNILADHKAQGNAMLSEMGRLQSDREKATGKKDYYQPTNTPIAVPHMPTSDLADAHTFVSMRLNRSLEMLDIVEKKARGKNGWFSNFGEGVGEGLANELESSVPIGHRSGSDYLQNLIKRYNKGEKLNKEDSALLDAFAYSNTIDSEMVRHIPASYKIGETTGASIPFMIDFLAANAVAGVGEIGAKVGGKITQKALQAMIRNGLIDNSRGLTRFGAKLLGGVARVATDAGVAGIMTAANPRQMGKITSNAYEMLEGKPLASTSRSGAPKFGGVTLAPQETSEVKAFAKSFGDQWIENWSEMAGGWIGGIGKGSKNFGKAVVGGALNDVKKAAPQMMANYGSSSIGGALTQGYKAAVNIGKKAGFNGVVEENLEEYVGNAARVMILGGDHTWDKEFSPEQIKETFVGLLPTMLMFGAIGGVSTAGQHATSARQLKEYEDKLKARGIDTDKAREQMSNMSFNEYVQHEAALLTKARIKHAEAEALLERKDAGANKAMEAAKEAEEKAMFALHFAQYQGVRGVDTEAIQEAREAHEREVDRSIDNSVKSVSHLLSQEHNPDNTPNPTAGTYSRVEHNGKEYVVRNGKFKAVAQRDMESGAPIKDRNGNVSYEVDADELLYLQDANGNVVPVYSSDVTPLGETIRLDGLKNSAKSILMSDASGSIQPSAIIDESTLRELSDPNNNLPYVQAEPSAFVSSEEVEQAQSDIAGMEPQGEQQEQVPQGVPQIEGGVDDSTEASTEEESFVLNDDEEQEQGEWDNLDDYDPNRPIEVGDDVLFDSDGRGYVKTGVVSQVSDDAYYIQAQDGGMYVIPLEQGIWHNMFNRKGWTPKEHNTQEQESGVVDTTSPEEVVPEDQQEADPQTAEEWVAYFDGDIEAAINWIENTIHVLKKDLSKLEKKGKKVNAGETPSEYKARIQESRVVIDAIRAKIEENEGILSDLQGMLVDEEAEEPQEETNKSEEVNEVEEEDVAPIEESEEEEENHSENTPIEEENESEEAATSTTKDDSVEEEEPIAQSSEEKEVETTETTISPTESEEKSQKEESEDEKTDGGQESKPSQEEGSNTEPESKTASEVLDEVVAENVKSQEEKEARAIVGSVFATPLTNGSIGVLRIIGEEGGKFVYSTDVVLKTGVDTSRHVESTMSRSSLMSYYPWNYLELPSDVDITDTNAVFEAFEKAENNRKSLGEKSGSSRILHKMSEYGETVYVHSMNLPFRNVLKPCFFVSRSKSPLRYGDASLVRLRKYWREEEAIDVANETLSYLHEANKKEEEERKKEEERMRLDAEEKAAKDEELNQKYKGYLSNKTPMQRARIIKQLEHKFLSVGDESLSVFDYIIRMWENGTLKLEEESFVESKKNKHLETIDKNVHEYQIYDTNGHTYYVITKTSYDFAKYLEGLEKNGEEKSEVGDNKQEKLPTSEQPDGNTKETKQKSKKKDSKKEKEFDSSVWAFTTEDPTRPMLAGVYHDGGYAVATNMHVLIAEKAAYDPSKEGSIVDRKGNVIDAKFPGWRAIIPENLDSFNMDFWILVDKLREVRSKIEKEILADRGISRISPKIKNEASGSVISVRFPNGVDLQFELGYMESFANAAVRLGITEMGMEKGQDCYRIFAQNKNGILGCVTIHLGRNTPSIESIDLENVAQEENIGVENLKEDEKGALYHRSGNSGMISVSSSTNDTKLRVSSLPLDTEVEVVTIEGEPLSYEEAKKAIDRLPNSIAEERTPDGVGELRISKKSREKLQNQIGAVSKENKQAYMDMIPHLGEIISNSILLEEHRDRIKSVNGKRYAENESDPNIDKVQRLYGITSINGVPYRVKTTVRVYGGKNWGSRLHNYDITEIELLAPNSATPTPNERTSQTLTNNSISIAKLIEGVGLSYEKGKLLADAMKEAQETRNGKGGDQRTTISRLIDQLKKSGLAEDVVVDKEAFEKKLEEVDKNARYKIVFHGSPHDFDSFDHSKMGSGEGAQAYGWGTYVTEVKGIAKIYSKVSDKNIRVEYKGRKIDGAEKDAVDFLKYTIEREVERSIGGDAKEIFDRAKKQSIRICESNITDAYNEAIEQSSPEKHEEYLGIYEKVKSANNKTIEIIKPLSYEDFNVEIANRNLYTVEIPNPNERDKNGNWNFYFPWDEEISDVDIDVLFDVLKEDVEDENISLVRGVGEDVYQSLIDTLGSNELASKFLSRCNYVGISYPAEHQSGGRKDKARNYVIFDENNLNIVDHVQFLKNGEQVYGFVSNGVVYLNPDLLNTNTPIHEFAHLWNSLIKQKEPELWNEGVGLVKDSSYIDEVRKNPYYSQLSEEDQLDEAMAMAIGDFGAKEIESKGVRGASLRAWIGKVWDKIRSFLGAPKREYKNLDDFARTALNDLLGGINLGEKSTESGNVYRRGGTEHSENLDTINERAERDREYMMAVESGDMEKAQAMVNEEAERKGYSSSSSYQGTSAFNGSAPYGNGYFLSKEERKEAWDNEELEGDSSLGDYIDNGVDVGNIEFLISGPNYRHADAMRKEAIENIRSVVHGKKRVIKMYRSVPSWVKEGSFRNGDWVTPSRLYAEDNARVHGWGDDYRIIEQDISIDDVWFDGNDIAEFGYGREEDYTNDKDFAYRNVENNRKLLDPVTYDDNGNVIPLSKRFDSNKHDVRFHLVDKNLTEEELAIVERTKNDGSYMKAPNGADTNLTERQWLQVRTKAFKNWFGDWEKKARIEKLRKSKTVEIIGNEIDPSDDLKQYKKNALEYGKRLQGHYINKDTGRSIQLQRGRKNGGLKEVLQHDITDIVHLQSVAAIPQIVESSIYIDSEENTDVKKNPNVSKYHYYVCGLRINGVDYTVRMVEAEEKNGSRYYDHKLTHIEKGKLIDELAFYKPSPTELSSTSGLGATNRNRPTDRGETLQAPVSATKDNRLVSLLQVGEVSKVVDENGEPLVVYHGTKSSFNSFDNRKKGRNDYGLRGKGFYMSPRISTAKAYGEEVKALFVNIRNPFNPSSYSSSKEIADYLGMDEDSFRTYTPFAVRSWASGIFSSELQEHNHDGVIYKEVQEVVAFYPNQIKSATDNVGSFDGSVDDIRYRNEERTPEQIVSENDSAYDTLYDRAGVEKKAKSVVDKLSVPIDVKVKSKHEVPRSARNTKGYYDPKSGEVVVVLENVSSREDLEKTILHEVIGHKGLDALIPEADRDAFFNGVYNLLSEEQLLPIMARYPNAGKRELAEEFIAHLAEGYVHPTLITRVSKAIRSLLRSLGFNLRLTDGEVMTLLYRGSVALKRESATAAQEIAYINQDKAVSESMSYMDELNAMSLDELRDEVGENGVKLAQRMRLLESLGESERLRYRADEAFKEIDVENVDRSAVADSMNKAFTGKKVGEHKIPTWTQFLEETQDDLISLRKYQENVEKSIGKKLPSYLNIDKVFNQMSSRAAAAEELLVDIFEKEVGGVIRKLEKEKKITYRDIQLYVMAKHAIERNQVKRQKEIEKLSNPTSGDIARIMQQDFSSELDIQYGIEKHLKGSKNPIFSNVDGIRSYIEAIENSAGKDIDALWSSINKLNGEALKMWHEAGMISKDHYNNIKKLYKYYVPLQGIDDETIEDVWTYYGVSNRGDYSLVKDAEGRSKLPDNPFMVMRKSISNTAYMAEHNKAKVVVLALAQTHPTDYLIVRNSWDILTTDANGREEWKEVMPESEEGAVTEESMIAFEEKMQALEEEGKAKRHEHEPISNIGGYRVSNRNTLEEHLIRVSVNGKEQVVFVNGSPSFAQAVNRENRGKEREFLSKVAMVTRLKAAFATSLSIPFAFTNGVRDLLWSLSSSGIRYGKDYEVRFLRYYTKAGKFLFSPEDKRDEKMNLLWGEFKKNGGRTGYASMVGDENARKLAQKGLSRSIGKRNAAIRAVNNAGKAISYLGETIEDLTRFAAYCAAREGGKSVTDSIDVAKEMTVNFNRRGKGSTLLMRSIFSFYMFINANIQGTTQLIKMFKNHPVGTSVMAGAYAMLPMFSAILTKLIGDDDDYFALSDYERTHNLIICLGSGKFIKVPMPQEMYPFLAIGNSISELAFGESSVTDALLGSADGILDGATFGLDASSSSMKHFNRAVSKGEENPTYLLFRGFVPSILQPFTDSWNNWDYVGRHIEKPAYGKNTPKYQRVYENKAWGWLVGLSKAINGDDIKGRAMQDDGIIGTINSPANAQYLIESWLGGVVSMIAKDVRFVENLFKGENFFESASNAAVLGRFMHFDSHLQEKKMQSDFYKAKEEIGIAQKKINEIQKGIKANEEAISIYEEEGNYVMVGILEDEIEEAMGDIMEITNGKDPELYKDASDMFKDYSKEQRQLRELLNSTTDEELRSEIQEQIYNSNEEIMGYYNELLSD